MVRKPNDKKQPNENIPLEPNVRNLHNRALISRLQNALHARSAFGANSTAANRPQRMRSISGLSSGAKQAYERSQRRNDAKNKLGFRLKGSPQPFAPEVTMADGTSPSGSGRRIFLPQVLPRPDYKPINIDLLRTIAPEIANTNAVYVEECMLMFGPEMLKSLYSIKIENISANVVHDEMTVTFNFKEKTQILPSHILAIYGPVPKTAGPLVKRPVTLYPVHTLILALNCAHLPTPPPMLPVPKTPAHPDDPQQIQLPVMSLALPSPQSYPYLSVYLYTKQLPRLISSFLPSIPPKDFLEVPEQGEAYASHLATAFKPDAVVRIVHIVHGLWQNMCALGIFDEALWYAIDALWKVLIRALTLAVGEPTVIPLAQRPRQPPAEASSSTTKSESLDSDSDSEQSDDSAPAPTSSCSFS